MATTDITVVVQFASGDVELLVQQAWQLDNGEITREEYDEAVRAIMIRMTIVK